MITRHVAAAAACAALLAAALHAGQQEPRPASGPQGQIPTFRGAAGYVRLDVYADAGGQPVQDLRQEEFEVFEDGVPQAVATFEHVAVRRAGPAEARIDPSTVREERQMASDPRARLFVLFLDTYHVDGASGRNVRGPLLRLLDRAIGEDDLVAVMTPEMSGAAVTFSRRTGAIAELLDRYWEYGKRFRRVGLDPDEEMYDACYPPKGAESGGISAIALEMIDRRREKMALDALEDLVIHLEGLREERKGIFVVSQGWVLYRPNADLARVVDGQVPGRPPQIGVGPDGRVRSGDLGRTGTARNMSRCDQDRIRLSQEDHEQQFRRLLDLANRANATFYPIDPRGLPVFDAPIGGMGAQPSPRADQVALRSRVETLHNLASATDGTAIVNSNDIDAGLRRVVDDLTSYYLVGYYSTNTKLDGRFRSVKVRVTRPGVTVRTRRGYVAPTREEVEARAATGAPGEAGTMDPAAAAIASLGRVRPSALVHAGAGYEWLPREGQPPGAALWVAAELDPAAARDAQWKEGAELTVALTAGATQAAFESRQTLSASARGLRVRLPGEGQDLLPPGEYAVRVTARPVAGTLSTSEVLHVTVPAPPPDGRPAVGLSMLLRRGPFTGPAWQAAGDLRFRRQERVRLEIPVLGAFSATATRLLDRTGKPLGVPVAPAEREGAGVKYVGGDVTLAPLAAGDYLLETTIEHAAGTEKILTAFRIIS